MSRRRFTAKEDALICAGVAAQRSRGVTKIEWFDIFVPGRTPVQVRHRWSAYLNTTYYRGKTFSKSDEELLLKLVDRHGPRWSYVSSQIPAFSPAQARTIFVRLRGRWGPYNVEPVVIVSDPEFVGEKPTRPIAKLSLKDARTLVEAEYVDEKEKEEEEHDDEYTFRETLEKLFS